MDAMLSQRIKFSLSLILAELEWQISSTAATTLRVAVPYRKYLTFQNIRTYWDSLLWAVKERTKSHAFYLHGLLATVVSRPY